MLSLLKARICKLLNKNVTNNNYSHEVILSIVCFFKFGVTIGDRNYIDMESTKFSQRRKLLLLTVNYNKSQRQVN